MFARLKPKYEGELEQDFSDSLTSGETTSSQMRDAPRHVPDIDVEEHACLLQNRPQKETEKGAEDE
eukprot:8304553-Alexandrium_andersonii.AAC.1